MFYMKDAPDGIFARPDRRIDVPNDKQADVLLLAA